MQKLLNNEDNEKKDILKQIEYFVDCIFNMISFYRTNIPCMYLLSDLWFGLLYPNELVFSLEQVLRQIHLLTPFKVVMTPGKVMTACLRVPRS